MSHDLILALAALILSILSLAYAAVALVIGIRMRRSDASTKTNEISNDSDFADFGPGST